MSPGPTGQPEEVISARPGPVNPAAPRPGPSDPRPRVAAMQHGIPIGAHVDQTDPLAEAAARQAPLVQFFLGDPQGYQGPEVAYAGGAEALREDAAAAGSTSTSTPPTSSTSRRPTTGSGSPAASCSSSTSTPRPRSARRG